MFGVSIRLFAPMRRDHLNGPRRELRRKLTDLQERFQHYVLNLWLNICKLKLTPLCRGSVQAKGCVLLQYRVQFGGPK